jgi:hypothetical protein
MNPSPSRRAPNSLPRPAAYLRVPLACAERASARGDGDPGALAARLNHRPLFPRDADCSTCGRGRYGPRPCSAELSCVAVNVVILGGLQRDSAGLRSLARVNTGAPGGIRTPNLLIRSQMLYPLSHGCGRLVRQWPPSNTVRVYRPRLVRPTDNEPCSTQCQLSRPYSAVEADLAQQPGRSHTIANQVNAVATIN